ncbi:histone-arginine methyltransferase METTL23-like [Watersipora subatra]|uniref:histone-arginine methyltransferase METTL23-like n=1 Tax=Watersipora subatra TaxID=2589382 RepID=UPI00355BBC48
MESVQTKTWDFTDGRDDSILVVTVQELLDADSDYGLYTWPCATVLSQYLIHKKMWLKGKAVIELGSGTGLAGLVALRCGAASVLLTDHAEKRKVLQNCQSTVESQGYSDMQVCGLTWGHFSPQLLNLRCKVDLIIAADCFYSSKDFEPVLVTVAYLLETNMAAEFWCTYQVRSADRSFDFFFEKWQLKCTYVPLSEFTEDITAACRNGTTNPTEIQLMIITLCKAQD